LRKVNGGITAVSSSVQKASSWINAAIGNGIVPKGTPCSIASIIIIAVSGSWLGCGKEWWWLLETIAPLLLPLLLGLP
jgi:hypothetical protein